jgi:hypothetical protein
MNIRRVINKHLRRESDGVQVAGEVNTVVSANVGERGSVSHTSNRQRTRVVQRSGKTVVSETEQSQDPKGETT